MFTVLNSESLWIGTDLKRFNEIRDILDSQNIKYKYKVKDQLRSNVYEKNEIIV